MKLTHILAVGVAVAWTAAVTSPVWAANGAANGDGTRNWSDNAGSARNWDGNTTRRRDNATAPTAKPNVATQPRTTTTTTSTKVTTPTRQTTTTTTVTRPVDPAPNYRSNDYNRPRTTPQPTYSDRSYSDRGRRFDRYDDERDFRGNRGRHHGRHHGGFRPWWMARWY